MQSLSRQKRESNVLKNILGYKHQFSYSLQKPHINMPTNITYNLMTTIYLIWRRLFNTIKTQNDCLLDRSGMLI